MTASKNKRREWLVSFSFTVPFLIFYLAFVCYPVVQAVLMSFFNWPLLGHAPQWLGADNYLRMLGGENIVWSATAQWQLRLALLAFAAFWAWRSRREHNVGDIALIVGIVLIVCLLGFHPGEGGSWNDPRFWNALRNTVIFTVVSTPIIASLGLLFALLLNKPRRKMTGLYRAALFVPYILPVSVATLIWGYLLNPSRGLVGKLTETIGQTPIAWLSDPRFAMGAIIVTTVWWTVGFNMVLFGAGLQDIDPALYEAAQIDGAGRWQQFRYITLPGLRHATLLVLVTQIIASFQIFGQVNIMTGGGPGNTTDVVVRYIYQTGFRDMELGYASAMSLFLFVVMVVVSFVQFLMSRERKLR